MRTTIHDACTLVTDGTHYTPEDIGHGIPFLTVKDVSDQGLDFTECSRISEADFISAKQANCAPQFGDVLFSKDGTVGKVHVVRDNRPFAVLSSLAILRPNPEITDSRYLGHVLGSPGVLREATKKKTGSAIRRIILSDLKSVSIWLPSIRDQLRIADILDRADALRAKRRAALARLDELTQAIFVEMFGDPIHGPKKCRQTSMGELFSEPPIFGSMIPPEIDGGAWLSLRVGNIQDWRLDLSDKKYIELPANMQRRHSVKDGDVLLARAIASQEHLGKAIVVYPGHSKWAFDSHLMRLRFNPQKAEPRYIQTLLKNPSGRALFLKASRRSAVQYNINTVELSGLVVPIPEIEAQRDFIRIIDQISKLRASDTAAYSSLDSLFASLQDRAFRGVL